MDEAGIVYSSWIKYKFELKTYFFFNDDHGDTIRADFTINDKNVVYRRTHLIELLHMFLFKRICIFLNAPKTFVQVLHDFLRTNNPDDLSRTRSIRAELTACIGCNQHVTVVCHSMYAASSVSWSADQFTDLAALSLTIHREHLGAQCIKTPRLINLLLNPKLLECYRGTQKDLGFIRNQFKEQTFRLFAVFSDQSMNAICFKSLDSAGDLLIIRQFCKFLVRGLRNIFINF